jgi:hypothetical protein
VLARSEERRATRGGGAVRGAARAAVREGDAEAMVRRAYLSVLNREPDEGGLRDYTAKVVNEGWTEAQVIRALRESDEYRNRVR